MARGSSQQTVAPGGCGSFREGRYYDVIPSALGGDWTGRLAIEDFGGRVALHCHVLAHADAGMMAWVQVDGAPAADTATYDDESPACACSPSPAP